MKKTIVITAILLTLFLGCVAMVQAETYSPVTTITGSSDQTTNYFTVPSGEWRVTWSYTPKTDYPDLAMFAAYVYPKGETIQYTANIMQSGATQTSGATYIHEGQQEYYLKISVANIESYSLTIEAEATTSPTPTVPEYTVVNVLVMMVMGVLSVLLFTYKKKGAK